jgi:hypothetical protein
MAQAAGVGTDRPPVKGSTVVGASACRLGRERFVFDIGDSDQPRSCFIWRGVFASASSRPASPRGDTDGYIEECRSPVPHTACVVWLACPRPSRAADSTACAATMAKSHPAGVRTSAVARSRSSARVSPPLLCGKRRQASRATSSPVRARATNVGHAAPRSVTPHDRGELPAAECR